MFYENCIHIIYEHALNWWLTSKLSLPSKILYKIFASAVRITEQWLIQNDTAILDSSHILFVVGRFCVGQLKIVRPGCVFLWKNDVQYSASFTLYKQLRMNCWFIFCWVEGRLMLRRQAFAFCLFMKSVLH